MKTALIGLLIALYPATPQSVKPPDDPHSWVYAEVTTYTSSPDETDDTPDITASGTKTRHGTLACPSRLAFGRKVEILGKKYTCEDRMNARYRDKEIYDIWVETKAEAYKFGKQKLIIKIYDNGKDN